MNNTELEAELEKLHPASFGWALSCCRRDQAEAEEVLQTVYLKILEGKACYRGEASFKTWLFAVIRKTALSEYRRTLLRRLKAAVTRAEFDKGAQSGQEPDAAFERSESQERFRRALQDLPARQREALHLVFYEDLSLSEAAEVMNVSLGSTRQHYERGKKRLRQCLEQSENTYGIGWRRKENPGAV